MVIKAPNKIIQQKLAIEVEKIDKKILQAEKLLSGIDKRKQEVIAKYLN